VIRTPPSHHNRRLEGFSLPARSQGQLANMPEPELRAVIRIAIETAQTARADHLSELFFLRMRRL